MPIKDMGYNLNLCNIAVMFDLLVQSLMELADVLTRQ
jgi:hypothetical protein